jgi:hypothetical protein
MNQLHPHPACGGIKPHDRQVCDDLVGAAARGQARFFTAAFARQKTGAGNKIDIVGEPLFVLRGYHHGSPAEGGQVVGTAAAGKAHLGLSVISDEGGVNIPVHINLGSPQKGVIHHTPLAVSMISGMLLAARPFIEGPGIADGNGHGRQYGAHAPGFKKIIKLGADVF